MITIRRVLGRFASQVQVVPFGDGGLVQNGRLHIVNPPQITTAVYQGRLVNLEPINNKVPCWREIETVTDDNIIGTGKDKDKHDSNPDKGRRIVSRKSTVLTQTGILPSELWKKAFKK